MAGNIDDETRLLGACGKLTTLLSAPHRSEDVMVRLHVAVNVRQQGSEMQGAA
jgi:hypothetical protein